MKTKNITILLTLICFLFVAEYIIAGNVYSPTHKEPWCKGKTYPIKWHTAYFGASEVNIILFRANTRIMPIIKNVTNNGEYPWTIPATLAEGYNYRIKIKVPDQNVSDFSPYFTVKYCGIRRKNDPNQQLNKPNPTTGPLSTSPPISPPDFIIKRMFFNETNGLYAVIKNQGLRVFSGRLNFMLKAGDREKPLYGTDGIPPESIQVNLPPGIEKNVHLPFILAAEYLNNFERVKFHARVNSDNSILESNYENNDCQTTLHPKFQIVDLRIELEKTEIVRTTASSNIIYGIRYWFKVTTQATIGGTTSYKLISNRPGHESIIYENNSVRGGLKFVTLATRAIYLECAEAGDYWIEAQILTGKPNFYKSNRIYFSHSCE